MNETEIKQMMVRKLSPKYDAECILGRKLEYVCLSRKGKCADCCNMSKFLIVEKKELDKCDKCGRSDNICGAGSDSYYKAWYYCGICAVG